MAKHQLSPRLFWIHNVELEKKLFPKYKKKVHLNYYIKLIYVDSFKLGNLIKNKIVIMIDNKWWMENKYKISNKDKWSYKSV